jgi:hypothetical protein
MPRHAKVNHAPRLQLDDEEHEQLWIPRRHPPDQRDRRLRNPRLTVSLAALPLPEQAVFSFGITTILAGAAHCQFISRLSERQAADHG